MKVELEVEGTSVNIGAMNELYSVAVCSANCPINGSKYLPRLLVCGR